MSAAAITSLFGGAASAHAPTLAINSIGGQDATGGAVSLQVNLGSNVDVVVGLTHGDTEDDKSFNALKDLKLFVQGPGDSGFQQHGATVNPGTDTAGCGNFTGSPVTSGTCTLPWTINAFGAYTLKAQATHGNTDGTSADVTATIAQITVLVGFPAAPAIANAYLNANGDARTACVAEFGPKAWRGSVVSGIADWHVVDGVNRKLAYEAANDLSGWETKVQDQVDILCA